MNKWLANLFSASLILIVAGSVRADAAVDSSTLDDNEKQAEAIGIVGFSFKYVGEDYPRVGNLLPEGPAAKLDIRTNDQLLAVNGQDASMLSINKARRLLTGKPGEPVIVKLKRDQRVFEQTVIRMPSSDVKDQRLRNMIEHYRSRQSNEADVPLVLCQFCEPGPTVVEFTAGGAHNKLLQAKEKEGLSVKRVALDDSKSYRLLKSLGFSAKSQPCYYFAGVLTAQGVFEKRSLTPEILAADLKQINWLPGQDSLHKSMIEQYETLRKQSWQPSANVENLKSSPAYKDRCEAAAQALTQYLNLHNGGGDHSSAMKALIAPEALSLGLPPLGKLSFEQSQSESNVLVIGENYAVVRTRLEEPKPLDVYFYLRKDPIWKITAVRALACNGPLSAIAGQLERKQLSEKLSDEESATLQNLQLTLSTDKDLKAWFKKNTESMEQLALAGSRLPPGTRVVLSDHLQPTSASESKTSRLQTDENLEIKAKLKGLHLASLNKVGERQIEIIIGGVTDNTVGFLYAPDNKPPLLGPSEYIWVEKVADKWYLIKTT